MDFHRLRLCVGPQPKMHRPVARRGIAQAGGHVVILRAHGRADHLDARANPVSIAPDSPQSDIQPVASVLAPVHPDLRGSGQRRRHHVHAAVTVEIPQRAAAMPRLRRSIQPGFLGESSPFPARSQIAKDGVVLGNLGSWQRLRLHVAARNKQILPSVIVEVIQSRAEAGHLHGQVAQPAGRRHLAEIALAGVLKQRKGLVIERHKGYIRVSVVIEIAKIQPHA